jgi:two-component system, NarL family, sensor histidine kinase UhpB
MEARAARSTNGLTVPEAPSPERAREVVDRLPERLARRYRTTSLYARVVVINAAILTLATVLLVLTPATVGYPVSLAEAAVLLLGVALVVVANAIVLRISFGGLATTVARMKTVDLLHPQERLPEVGGPETRRVVAGLNQMLARLEAERRESSRRTLAALEEERRRIAQELHDEIGQRLTGILLRLGDVSSDAPAGIRTRLDAIQEDARSTLDEVGLLAWQIRPGILDDLGLLRALQALVDSFDEQTPAVRIRTSLPTSLPRLAPESELAVYRIVQEAMTNAARHSGAAEILVSVAVEHDALAAIVRDDGAGIVDEDAPENTGLRGMRERAFAIDASLVVETDPERGVRVALRVPLPVEGEP